MKRIAALLLTLLLVCPLWAGALNPVLIGVPPPKLDVDLIPTMTGATTLGVTASASSEFSATFAAWKTGANDGSTSRWESAGAPTTSWLKYDLGFQQWVWSYTVLTQNSTVKATAWAFQGSNTGAFAGEEITLNSQTGQSPITVTAYTLANPAFFRYFRWNITANGGSVDVGMDEVEIRQ